MTFRDSRFYLFSVWSTLSLVMVCAPARAWVNQGFETGDMSGWTVTLNSGVSAITLPTNQVVAPGVAPDTNGTLCPAPSICLNQVRNGNFAAQIFSGNGDTNHGDWSRIEQTDTVPAGAPYVSFWFAAVLEGAHFISQPLNPESDSFVEAQILSGSTTIYTQRFSWYDTNAALVDDGFSDVEGGAIVPWKHLPWTQYYYDLTGYIGQQVTIRYTAYSCVLTGHYCWGYLDDAAWVPVSLVPSPTATWTPTKTMTPTVTLTPTATLTPTWTLTETLTPTPTPTDTPCGYPGLTCTPTQTPTVTPTFTPTCPIHLWPNPYNIQFAYNHTLKFDCVPAGSTLEFFTVSGELVYQEAASGYVTWDGHNQAGQKVSNGIYFYVVRQGNQVASRGKLLIISGH
jgi:hypothetical protein